MTPSSATPILKVMRLQSPELGQPSAGMIGTESLIGSALALPDSFGVIHIGETFTAYLGAINPSTDMPILRLAVSAQLQTPSRRWALPSKLDVSNNAGGVDVPPSCGVDAIVLRSLEEVGQHILRVEVGYGGNKTLRKFYRFNVASPLHIRELTMRAGDASCFVSIAIENATTNSSLTISNADFQPPQGLVAERIDSKGGLQPASDDTKDQDELNKNDTIEKEKSAVELFDGCGRLDPRASFRYLFVVRADSHDATLRGIACGDELGKAVFTWRKTMGEAGRIASTSVLCPPSQPPGLTDKNNPRAVSASGSKFVVHGSGLSVDAAAAAANRSAHHSSDPGSVGLDEVLPVTVEPIDPPSTMALAVPEEVQLLIVNHSDKPMNLQLQMRLAHMKGVVVCGPSFINLGEISPSGGSSVVGVRLVPLVAGLFRTQGCFIVDLTSGKEIPQPPLFHVFVSKKENQ
eukprot:CAMPEP_0195508432 /NCGR_PEP_ID=MMETSP0794_2-20130614/1638_1 /TAXON_ID=515487 /ORGANISM="Stephanopyxis turris, Strain CCMP 815" /LENGTH=461 /DNA_ID=CAMNT_0040635385 /DNA_START=51 /DNA_END=1436 /DNA_ORIENTATION=-